MRPVAFSASVDVIAGNTAPLDTEALQNVYRIPMWLDEVRWLIRSPTREEVDPGSGFIPSELCAMLSASIRTGHLELTNGFVPIWLFGHQMQGGFPEVETGRVGVDVVGSMRAYNFFAWKLPRPMLLPNGQGLVMNIARNTTNPGFVGPFNVTATMVGRLFEAEHRTPSTIDAPCVTAFVPRDDTAPIAISDSNDLRNPFITDFHVQRFVGRVQERVLEESASGIWAPGDLRESSNYNIPQVRMTDSAFNEVVKDDTPFSQVIEFSRKAWTFNRVLNEKESYTAKFNSMGTLTDSAALGASDPVEVALLPMMSMVGHRKELYAP